MSSAEATISPTEFVDSSHVLREIEYVRDHLIEHGYCIVRGALRPTDITCSTAILRRRFSRSEDVRKSLEFSYGQTPNFQRLDIGTYSGGVYQFCRSLFFFPWNID